MKIIKGFENEDIVVSDFGEWVGKDYIDYKAEYKRNQKFIEILLDENQKQKEVIDKVRNNLEKDISVLKTITICKEEIITRLEITNKMLKEVSE